MQRIVPMIAYEDAGAAIDWLTEAFGFAATGAAIHGRGGTVTRAGSSATGRSSWSRRQAAYRGPKRHRETCEQARRWQDNPWVVDGLFVAVDDVDAHRGRRGRRDGHPPARTARPPACALYGRGPEGHRWMFGQGRD